LIPSLDEYAGMLGSKVGLICPVCLKTHFKIGVQWVSDGTKRVMVQGDPYCSDECREYASKIPERG